MILVDANLLIYAIDSDAPLHRQAREWLEGALSGTTRVGLAWIVLLAFLRITTRAGILVHPLSLAEATDYVDSWLDQPFVESLPTGPDHWGILRSLLAATGTAGNLTSDAHIAALAIEHRATIYSTDHDFGRFPGVKHINPVASR
ncbi:MAG: type II toxin-antitoxin system VapC family toxin [Acidobacteria bacterium]|nr:type II toxin-antitoxin system VapC family toxin [Acidobacteriota bacterium]